MGTILAFCINKTGASQTVRSIETGNVVGELYNREAFVLYGAEGGLADIVFLGPNGQRTNAMVTRDGVPCFENYKTCLDYPYGRETIHGVPYKTFIMRQSMNIYKKDGTYWGKVAANMLVATNTATVGLEHNNWKEITYVQQSPNRNWIRVDEEGEGYGFVDTGLFSTSNYSKIPFYGSW